MPPRTHEELRSHFELHEAGHVFGLIERLRLTRLLLRYPPRLTRAVYVLITCFLSIAVVATVAALTNNPFIFPSLGPTAYLLFFTPLARASSPRHALLGHAIGLAFGYLALFATGTVFAGTALQVGVRWPTILGAAFSLSATGAAMVVLRVSHPPAGATTLIVSLGLISKPVDLVTMEAAVLLLVGEALVINRLAGLPYPWWEDRIPHSSLPH